MKLTNEGFNEVGSDELQIAFSGPSIWVNKFYVTVSGATVRIAFAEIANSEAVPQFRSSVTMSAAEFLQLKGLMEGIAKSVKTVAIPVGGSNA
jgi:hypothetical protein